MNERIKDGGRGLEFGLTVVIPSYRMCRLGAPYESGL